MPNGSSPLTRGKHWPTRTAIYTGGLIPAHAGKTECGHRSVTSIRAHPRSRGENEKDPYSDETLSGSSPLTRGKLQLAEDAANMGGLIPAHAGKTLMQPNLPPKGSAHPRSRGENNTHYQSLSSQNGSSPLTRGKHFLTCAFTAQIDQILETLELAASFGSYLIWVACATDAPQDPVRSIGLVLPSSMGAS